MRGTIESVWPPRLVEVRVGDQWRAAQLDAQQLGTYGRQVRVRFLERTQHSRALSAPTWVDEAQVRPRRRGHDLGVEMKRETWAPMGAQGEALHAIAVTRTDDVATALCGFQGEVRPRETGMKPCVSCQDTLKALVDAMPDNAIV